MQILNVKKKASKHEKTWIWEGLGLNLGGVWDALGRLLAARGRSVGPKKNIIYIGSPLGVPKSDIWRLPGRILGRFGDLGKIWALLFRVFGWWQAVKKWCFVEAKRLFSHFRVADPGCKNMTKKRTSAYRTGRFCSVSEGRSSWIFSVFRVCVFWSFLLYTPYSQYYRIQKRC